MLSLRFDVIDSKAKEKKERGEGGKRKRGCGQRQRENSRDSLASELLLRWMIQRLSSDQPRVTAMCGGAVAS